MFLDHPVCFTGCSSRLQLKPNNQDSDWFLSHEKPIPFFLPKAQPYYKHTLFCFPNYFRHLLHSFSKSSSFISIKVRKAKPLEVTSLHVDTDGSPKRGHPSPILSDLSATESKEVKYVNKEEYVEKWTKVHCNRKWSGEELNLVNLI